MLSDPARLHFCKLVDEYIKPNLFLVVILIILCMVYFSGIASVPFHPDESTQLTMSADFEALIRNPSSLGWDPEHGRNSPQTYRLLDAPITRYLLGIGRYLAGLPAPSSYWDWSLNWQANLQQGAMPELRTLLTGRLTISLLFPFSLVFLYISTRAIGGKVGGYTAIILLGMNALVLLHTRRAMAEGPLLFGITAVMASWLVAPRQPWLAGLAMAIAFNSKQSSLALLPVGLLAVSWLPDGSQRRPGSFAWNIIQYLLTFAALTWLLNPIAWQHPLTAAKAAVYNRADLLSQQIADTHRLAPSQVLDQPVERVVILLGHLYLTQPIFAEAENYHVQTADAESIYLESTFNNLGRNLIGAGFLLVFTLLGLFAAVRQVLNEASPERRFTLLTLMGTLCMAGGLLLAVPLPWQRYVLPLVPFVCLWSGVGFAWLLKMPQLIRIHPKSSTP